MVETIEFKAKDQNFLSSREAETIVAIAKKMKDVHRIRKTYLRRLIDARNSTFARAINFLKKVDIILERFEYPNTPEGQAQKGHKYKYVVFNHYSAYKIAESLESLLAYQQIDLSKYPIRKIDSLNDNAIINLKKYIYRIEHQSDKVKTDKILKVYDILDIKKPSKITSIRKLYQLDHRQMYYCLKKLIEKGKIDLGYNKSMNSVVAFKNIDYIYSHTRWRCNNCGHWNPGSNSKFCGKCGDKR